MSRVDRFLQSETPTLNDKALLDELLSLISGRHRSTVDHAIEVLGGVDDADQCVHVLQSGTRVCDAENVTVPADSVTVTVTCVGHVDTGSVDLDGNTSQRDHFKLLHRVLIAALAASVLCWACCWFSCYVFMTLCVRKIMAGGRSGQVRVGGEAGCVLSLPCRAVAVVG